MRINPIFILKKYLLEIILFTAFFIFSCLLMWKTFRLNSSGNMEIATKAWSDFAATIPLIRSFSLGSNFPPQYPIFAGPPIRYHFIFFMVVGFLEKIGVPLDWALNSISTLGFISLLIAIYLVGKIIFKSKAVGTLSVTLFLFLLFIVYRYSKKPSSFSYTKSLILGILLGLTPFLHFSVFVMSGVSLMLFFIIYPKIRLKIFTAGFLALLLAIPQYLYMGRSEVETSFIHPGYLIENLTTFNFLKYWFMNLGLTILLAPIGFMLAKKEQRNIIFPFLSFFIIGNIFQFTPDMPTNHKFFNLFLIGINFFTAFFLVKICIKNILGKVLVIIILPLLILSGVIDFFPIVNDRYMTIQDIPNNKVAKYIAENTPKDSVFLNSSYLYNPASLAGRKIFMGWPYFAWSAGYDTNKRQEEIKKLFNPYSQEAVCEDLNSKKIGFIEIQNPTNLENITINHSFFEKNFVLVFEIPTQNTKIYDVEKSCL